MGANGWRIMWLLVVFDCPVATPQQRRAYSQFRKKLLERGYTQLQFSVYLRHYPTLAKAEAEAERLKPSIPPGGHVVFFYFTDKQYGMTREFHGPKPTKKKPEKALQIELF